MAPPTSGTYPASSSGEQQSLAITPRFHHACDLCRRKKIKCDGTKPNCNNCQKAPAGCHYSLVAPRKVVRRGNMNNIKARLESLEQLIGPLVSQISRLNETLATGTPSMTDSRLVPPGIPNVDRTSIASDEAESNESESDSADSDANSVAINIEEHPTMPTVTHATRSQPGSSDSPMSLPLLECHPASALVTRHGAGFPSDKISRPLTQGHDTSSYMNIPPALRDELLAIFHYKGLFPLSRGIEALMTPRVGANIPDYLSGAAMAVGARYCNDHRVRREPAYYSGFALFEYAEAQLHSILDRPSLYGVATLLILSLYLIGIGNPRKSWLYVGMGLRMLVQLGLNTMDSPDHRQIYAQYDTEDLHMRRYLFWIAFIIDKLCAVGSGRFLMLNDEDVMVHLPPLSPTVAQWVQGGLPANPLLVDDLLTAITFADMDHYIIRIFSLHGQVGSFVNRGWKIHESSYERFQQLEHSLTRFYALLPDPFRLNSRALPVCRNPGDSLKLSNLVGLNVVYFASVIILYRSNLSRSVLDPRRRLPTVKQNSRAKCLEASRMITAIIESTSTVLTTELFPSFLPLMLAFGTTIYCNCVVSADRNLRAEACRAIQIHEGYFNRVDTYWGITRIMTEVCRSILVFQSELALVQFPFDSAEMITKGLYDIAVACSVGDKSNDEWLIPIYSQYTSELFALKINGWYPSYPEESPDHMSRETAMPVPEAPKFINELNRELWIAPEKSNFDDVPELTSRKRPRPNIPSTSRAGSSPTETVSLDKETRAWAAMLTEQLNRNTFSNVTGNRPWLETTEGAVSHATSISTHPAVLDIPREDVAATPGLTMSGSSGALLPNGGIVLPEKQPTLSSLSTSLPSTLPPFISGSTPLSFDHNSDQRLTSDNSAVTQTLLELLHGTQWGTPESTASSSEHSSDNTNPVLLSTLESTGTMLSGLLVHPSVVNPTTPSPAALEQYFSSISQVTNPSPEQPDLLGTRRS
ncbi:hypothetical protein IWQ61_003006 [Dispira simplex]|nr:hypothetical protein IWQ61_003006 [Dispira simplex]